MLMRRLRRLLEFSAVAMRAGSLAPLVKTRGFGMTPSELVEGESIAALKRCATQNQSLLRCM